MSPSRGNRRLAGLWRTSRWVKDALPWDFDARKSWSQEGEDLILHCILGEKRQGFYVDVGAHHPRRFSNTYLFYRRGWSGINIDAMPGSMRAFDRARRRDINLEVGIAEEEGWIDYYVFNEPALNGFSRELSEARDSGPSPYRLIDTLKVKVEPLAQVLDLHLGEGTAIDFLSVDVEGLDLAVLKSNDWVRYRPRVVVAEILDSDLWELRNDPTLRFMQDQGYRLCAKTVRSSIFLAESREATECS